MIQECKNPLGQKLKRNHSDDPFAFALNVITSVVLTVPGILLPKIAQREKKSENER